MSGEGCLALAFLADRIRGTGVLIWREKLMSRCTAEECTDRVQSSGHFFGLGTPRGADARLDEEVIDDTHVSILKARRWRSLAI